MERKFYMNTENIKVVMSDVDGTLLTDAGTVSPNTIDAIKKLRKKGILFGICSGRDLHNVKELIPGWGLSGLVDAIVGSGGAEIFDSRTDTYECFYPLSGSLIWEIIKHFKDMDINFAIPDHGILLVLKEDRHIRSLSAKDHIPYKVIDRSYLLDHEFLKMMIICDPENMEQVIRRSRTFSDQRYKSSALQTAAMLYEYMAPRISKTFGLEQLMKRNHFTMENLCTFGDADNDYDMTKHAGIGVVMANGSKRTKSAADYVTDDNNHDGISKFVHKFF